MSDSPSIGSFNPFVPPDRFKVPDRPQFSSVKKRAHEIALHSFPKSSTAAVEEKESNAVEEKESNAVEEKESNVSPARMWQMRYQQRGDVGQYLYDVHSLCLAILKCQDLGQKIKPRFLEDLSTIKRQVDLIRGQMTQGLQEEEPPYQEKEPPYQEKVSVDRKLYTIERSLDTGSDYSFPVNSRFFFTISHKAFRDRVKDWNSKDWNSLVSRLAAHHGENFQEHIDHSLVQYVKLAKTLSNLEKKVGLSEEEATFLEGARQAFIPIRRTFETIILPALREKCEETQKEYISAVKALDRSSALRKRKGQESAASLIQDVGRFQQALLALHYQKGVMELVLKFLSPPEGWHGLRNNIEEARGILLNTPPSETVSALFTERLAALAPKKKFAFKQQLVEQLKREDPYMQATTRELLASINEDLSLESIEEELSLEPTKEELSLEPLEEELSPESNIPTLLNAVESDLLAVQRSLDTHNLDHFFFSSFYDAFEEQVEHWNFLAEHPQYPNGECLQENAYDSWIQYVDLEKRLRNLEESESLSEKEEALLEEARQTLIPIRETFETVVLPTLKEKLAESQKEFRSAVKALDRSSTFRKHWSRDSAASLLEDFWRFQHAKADLSYQKYVMESTLASLPPERGGSHSEKMVKEIKKAILWDANVSVSSFERGDCLFANRIAVLPPKEKAAFKQLLSERLKGDDPSVVQETRAFLRGIDEVIQRAPALVWLSPRGISSRKQQLIDILRKPNTSETRRSICRAALEEFDEPRDPFFKDLATMARREQKKFRPNETAGQFYHRVIHLEYLKAVETSHAEWKKQENKLIDKLEKGPSLSKQRAFGLFLLTLQGLQGLTQEEGLTKALLTKPSRDFQHTGSRARPSRTELQEFRERYAAPGSLADRGSVAPLLLVGKEPFRPARALSRVTPNIHLQAYLVSALTKGDLQDAIKLIRAGADPNIKGPDGRTAEELAVSRGDMESVYQLLEAAPNTQFANGDFPLHRALALKQYELMISLVKKGADLHATNADGQTVFHLALQRGDEVAVKVLLDRGAKCDQADAEGKYPLQLVREANMRRVVSDAIDSLQKSEMLFDELSEKKAIPQDKLEYYVAMRQRATFERALANLTIANDAQGAKRQIYLDYAEEVFKELQAQLQDRQHPHIQPLFEQNPFPLIEEESLFWLAQTYAKGNKDGEAAKILTDMRDRYQHLNITKGYYLARTMEELGNIAMRKGDFQTALQSFKAAEEANRGKVLSTHQKLDLWIRESLCYRELKQFDDAILILSKVINDDAVSDLRLKAMYLRAETYELQKRPELARKQLESMVKKGGLWAKKAQEKLNKEYFND